ncbi:MAG: hypothetical protein ACOCXP_02925 [Candidatus Dojkabacteria bacterium]
MKVFYLASNSLYSSEKREIYQKTINYLQFKVGKKNLKTISRAGELKNNKEEIVKALRKGDKELKESDVAIIDGTLSTSEIGFALSKAISEKKPVLLLEQNGISEKDKLSFGLVEAGNYRQVTKAQYRSIEEVTKHIDSFLEDAKGKIDTKFILILPPEIDRYLNWAAELRRMHKAQVVRRAIEQVMQKDRDWKDFLRQN